MAFTGRLGTDQSQPGNLQPGSSDSGATTVSASFTADAVILATQTASFTADAVLLVTASASFTADAEIVNYYTFTANAVLIVSTSASFTADAAIIIHTDASFTVDAVVFYETTESAFTADAYIHLIVWSDDFNRANETPLGAPYYKIGFSDDINLASNTMSIAAGDFATYRGYLQFETVGIIQFDFYTGASANNNVYMELDALGGVGVVGNEYPFLVVQNDEDLDWTIYTPSSDAITNFSLVANTWYRAKANFLETEDLIKVWKVADPEPDWQETWPRIAIGIPSPAAAALYMGGRSSGTFLSDNLLLTSPYAGVLRQQFSFTANALFKKTQEFADTSLTLPTVRQSTNAQNSGAFVGLSTPSTMKDGDWVVVIGQAAGSITLTDSGTFRLTNGGPTLTRLGIYQANTCTYVVFFGRVVPTFFGDFSSWVWEWTTGTNTRQAVMMIVDDSDEILPSLQGFTSITATDTQTIPAGTAEIKADGTLGLVAFGGTASGLTSINAPIQAVEIADRSQLNVLSPSRQVLEVSATAGLAAGASPAWTANSQGANLGTLAVVVEVNPRGGIYANARIAGNNPSFLADAVVLGIDTEIWRDEFDDRFATASWGGVWQPAIDEGGPLEADGAVGLTGATGTGEVRQFGYPVVGLGMYTFDFLFEDTVTLLDMVTLETISATNRVVQLEITALGILLTSSTATFTAERNQWYSARLRMFDDYSEATVWRRGTTEPSTATVTSANLTAAAFTPRFWTRSQSRTMLDNIIAYSSTPSWKRFYVFSANAVIQHTTAAVLFFDAEFNRGGRFLADAWLRNAFTAASVSADAVLWPATSFRADAWFIEDIRMRHERDGPEHLGVDYESVHTLAASIGIYPQGMNLRDVLIAIDDRLEALEAQ